MSFSKILVANRGEIAVRILRTARELGYRTVAVASDADRDAPHLRAADETVMIGPAPAAESYLRIDRLLAAAERTGADAVHPGYGFLAENADFARRCREAGLVFVGPPAPAIEAMGHKGRARERMAEAGVPCVPGYDGADQGPEALRRAAAEVGYPLVVKAAAGGGGRGMRRVDDPAELDEALERARSEAASAFGVGDLLLERWLGGVRHVEVQVFGDSHGSVLHLGERDCSLQRRHQKIVEECPSPAVDAELRRALGEAAVAAAKAVGYRGAGTVELLLDADRRFYFLEMNTRLQVEHPVTELVTGIDLVAWQLREAAGEPLPLRQEEVALRGHAIEARLYAEDPHAGFLPQAGRVALFRLPSPAPGVRVDAGVETGSEVPPHYDPLLAKVIAWGADREEARRRLLRALGGTVLFGPRHNRGHLLELLRHPDFVAGRGATDFVDRHPPSPPPEPPAECLALAAVLISEGEREPGDRLWGWSSSAPLGWTVELAREEGEGADEVRLVPLREGGYRATVDGEELGIAVHELDDGGLGDGEVAYEVDGLRRRAFFHHDDGHHDGAVLFLDGRFGGEVEAVHRFTEVVRAAAPEEDAGGRVTAPMAARVTAVRVAVGERVEAGQCLLVLEAMKLESRVEAPCAGTVAELPVAEGDQVEHRQLLAVIEPG
jgi:geranyl-CoA carboxylase alpha subunit